MTHENELERRVDVAEVLDRVKRIEWRLENGEKRMDGLEAQSDVHTQGIAGANALLKLSLENDDKILKAVYGRRFTATVIKFGTAFSTLGYWAVNHFKWWK